MMFECENLKRLGGYVSGEQPSRAKAKLNTNENPLPPCDAVLRVLASIDGEMLRRYPDPTARAFRAEAARLHGLIPDNIIATNGGDELLRLALTTFLPLGSPLGLAEPSYTKANKF
jgi:histidinol-phosphate aminotransferase